MKSILFAGMRALTVGLALTRPAMGQERADGRSVEAAIADLQDGQVDNTALFHFRACPVEDLVGLSVFQATRDMYIGGYQQARLALAWAVGGYMACDYAPLDSWMLQTFEQLRAEDDSRGAVAFASLMQDYLKPEVEDALLSAAEDRSFASARLRGEIVSRILFREPPESRATRAIELLQRDLPYDWKHSTVQYLIHSFPGEFLPLVGAAATSLPDDAVLAVASAIMYRIRDGELKASAPGVAAIRSELERRPNPPSWIGVLRGN